MNNQHLVNMILENLREGFGDSMHPAHAQHGALIAALTTFIGDISASIDYHLGSAKSREWNDMFLGNLEVAFKSAHEVADQKRLQLIITEGRKN